MTPVKNECQGHGKHVSLFDPSQTLGFSTLRLIPASSVSYKMRSVCKWVNHFPNKPWFSFCPQEKSFENTVGKEEIARNEQFLLFPLCFLPILRTFCHFHQT